MLTLAGLALLRLLPDVVTGWWACNYFYLGVLESVTPSAPAAELVDDAPSGKRSKAAGTRMRLRTHARGH